MHPETSEMTASFARPRVVISRCIAFDSCRYNGQVIRASLRDELEPWLDFAPNCPELEVGLGVPRDPIRLVMDGDVIRLEQPSTARDHIRKMQHFTDSWLSNA